MDLEREMELMHDRQARVEAEMERMERIQAGTVQACEELSAQIKNIARIVEDIAIGHKQAEEENREAHRRYEEAHRQAEEARKETDERFNILVKMMDEWIRERGKNRGPAS